MTNQNLFFVSALTGSLLGLGPLVCDKACRTSGLEEISSAVSTVAISLNSRRAMRLIVAVDEKLGPPPSAPEDPEPRFLRCLDPASQHFGNAPGLGDAAACKVRFAGVEDLTDCADAIVAEVLRKSLEESSGAGLVVRMYF